MFTTAVRHFGSSSIPMNPLGPRFRPEQDKTITSTIFQILREHGPLNVAQTWERVREAGLKDLKSKTKMKIVLRWMKQRQKVRQICNHVGPKKQFLYTTWFNRPPAVTQPKPGGVKSSQGKAT